MSTSNRSPPNENQATDVGPEIKAGGPLGRARAFMQQRFAVLRPRGAAPEVPEEGKGPLPPDFRRKLMAQYRQRQRSVLPPAAPQVPGEEPPEPPSSTDDRSSSS